MPVFGDATNSTLAAGGVIGGVVTVLGLAGGGIAWWFTRKDARADKAAATADARDETVKKELRDMLAQVKGEMKEMESRHQARHAENREEIHDLRDSLNACELQHQMAERRNAKMQARLDFLEQVLTDQGVRIPPSLPDDSAVYPSLPPAPEKPT